MGGSIGISISVSSKLGGLWEYAELKASKICSPAVGVSNQQLTFLLSRESSSRIFKSAADIFVAESERRPILSLCHLYSTLSLAGFSPKAM